nr:gas vesicle protein GvpG [uncultured Rhodopila sp.]
MIGSLLMSPMTGLTFIMREIAHAVDEAREAGRKAIMADLQELHRQIERGSITEPEFELREAALLDQLEGLSGNGADKGTGGAE